MSKEILRHQSECFQNASCRNCKTNLDQSYGQPRGTCSRSRSVWRSSERAVAELYASGVEDRILPVGSKAPEFALPDAGGRIIRSTDLLALGPLVINFFRGRWCPYCVTELETWRDLYGVVRKRGALLVGISPQTVRQNDFTAVQHGLGFPVLTDAGCKVAAQFGLAYAVAPSQQRYYRSILVNIPLVNGDASWQLPLPATYILGRDGTVLFADATCRLSRHQPRTREVLDVLLP